MDVESALLLVLLGAYLTASIVWCVLSLHLTVEKNIIQRLFISNLLCGVSVLVWLQSKNMATTDYLGWSVTFGITGVFIGSETINEYFSSSKLLKQHGWLAVWILTCTSMIASKSTSDYWVLEVVVMTGACWAILSSTFQSRKLLRTGIGTSLWLLAIGPVLIICGLLIAKIGEGLWNGPGWSGERTVPTVSASLIYSFIFMTVLGNGGALSLMAEKGYKALAKISEVDALTGAFLRRSIERKVREAQARWARHGCEFSIILMDIDHFKRINDAHGHPCGDAALMHACKTVNEILRTEDALGRIGGEEFLIVLSDTSIEGAMVVGERIRMALEASGWGWNGAQLRMTASFGVAMGMSWRENFEDIYQKADKALYEAKGMGRNQVKCWKPGLVSQMGASPGAG